MIGKTILHYPHPVIPLPILRLRSGRVRERDVPPWFTIGTERGY